VSAKKRTKFRTAVGLNGDAEKTKDNPNMAAAAHMAEHGLIPREGRAVGVAAARIEQPMFPAWEPPAEIRTELGARLFALLSSSAPEISGGELASFENLAAGCGTGWLSASVLALCAWFRNDQGKTHSCIEKAVFMDSHKTSLFFMLLMRRFGRREAASAWLTRYLDYQDPRRFDAEALGLADALQEGLFGEYGLRHLEKKAAAWYETLLLEPGFLERQRAEWLAFFVSRTPAVEDGDYPTLPSVVSNWNELKASRAWAFARKDIIADFVRIASSRPLAHVRLEEQLNAMLSGLAEGGESKARVDLSASLVKLVTEPDGGFQISGGARRMLLSMSSDTMEAEFSRYDKKMSGMKPVGALVGISGWYGTYDGSEGGVGELRESLIGHLNKMKEAKTSVARVSAFQWVALVAGLVMLGLAIPQLNPLFIVISLLPIIYWIYARIDSKKKIDALNREYSGYETEALAVFDKFASEIARFDAVYAEPEEEA